MTTLAANDARDYEIHGTEFDSDLPVIASDIIYEGAAVGENGSGYFRPLVAADPFAGFALAKADNSAGAAGAVHVHLRQQGVAILPVVGVTAVTDEGSTVYASDDDTFTLTSTSNTAIGKVIRVVDVTATKVAVFFQAASLRSI
jgi:predicted RecA/RadA family phage recombinase